MRKTSQDGGDNTSITSGVEKEIKNPLVGIMKTKRNSIKKKVQNFSHESDDAVIEPLLQKDKTDIPSQSAKHMLPKTKTESSNERGDDRDKLLSDERVEKPSLSSAPSAIGSISIMNGTKEILNQKLKLYEGSNTIHNHMNTNVFGSFDGVKNISTPKSQILVEIDSSKSTGYNPTPLIFTTAKIHTDGNTKNMEPVQVTPVPILSTIEGSVKIGFDCTDNILSGVSTKGNNIVNTNNSKSNHTESKAAKDIQITKTSVTVSNPSYSKIACAITSNTSSETKDGINVTTYNQSNNSSIKPVVSLDINNVPTKTIKSDLNTQGSNASTKCTFDNKEVSLKDISKICENVVDLNKTIERDKTLLSQGRLSDYYVGSTSSKMSKTPIELEKNKDAYGSNTINLDSKMKKIEMLPESNTNKINDNKYKLKDSSLPTGLSANLISSINNIPVSTKTSPLIPITTSKLTPQNVTSVTQTVAATTNTSTKSTEPIKSPNSMTPTSTSLVSDPVSTTAMLAKTTTTKVTSTGNPIVLNELSSSKPTATTQVSNLSKKPVDVSAEKVPISIPSSKVKSTVSTIITTTKTAATTSSSVQNVTSGIKTPSTQLPPANTVSVSTASVSAVTTNTLTGKAVDSSTINSKLKNNLTKTISSTGDGKKTNNTPLTNVPSVSSTKAPDISIKATKSTASFSKPSSSVTSSKPVVVSTAATSNSAKQPSTKPALAKPNSSTVSSVKTLITSSDKPFSASGSIKKSSNKQTESKGADSKKA